jgi:hypothetical protein
MLSSNANSSIPDLNRLIKGYLQGERAFQKLLYDRSAPKMMALCLRYCKNQEEAEEVLQDGFLQVLRFIDKYKRTGSPSSPQSESIVALYGLRKVNYGLFFKAEMQYAIRADWSVNLTLTSKNALTPINTNSSYSTYPYYIGLGLGLRYSF